jgi:hypothetical protein
MRAAAEDLLTDIPFQVWFTNTLKGAATTTEARRLARQLRAERRRAHLSSPNLGSPLTFSDTVRPGRGAPNLWERPGPGGR